MVAAALFVSALRPFMFIKDVITNMRSCTVVGEIHYTAAFTSQLTSALLLKNNFSSSIFISILPRTVSSFESI